MANRDKVFVRAERVSKVRENDSYHVCVDKIAFNSYKLAIEVAGNRRKTSTPRQAYKCPYCHKWHIGNFLRGVSK